MREEDLGISRFNLELDGIGGRLKVYPEDFVVTELDDSRTLVTEKSQLNESGIFLHIVVSKRNISHERMIQLLRNYYRVAEDQIYSGGIKDKRAITHQEVAIFQPRRNYDVLEGELGEGIRARAIGWSNKGITRGHIWGNNFDITIRECADLDDPESIAELLEERGVFNYYGYQRFGATRPVTAEFGLALLKKDYKGAVDVYLGMPDDENDEEFRRIWRETRDPEEVLNNSLDLPHIEKKVLESLVKYPADYRRALERMPRFLQGISTRAVISLLFNKYISNRPEGVNSGERKVLKDERENIEIALPSNRWERPLNETWRALFEDMGLEMRHLKRIRHSSRMLLLHPRDVMIETGDEIVRLKFQLPTGSYATIICRELMRTEVKNY